MTKEGNKKVKKLKSRKRDKTLQWKKQGVRMVNGEGNKQNFR